MTEKLERTLTVKAVARELQVSVGTVYNYIYEGYLKASKLGGNFDTRKHWRIKESDLRTFVEGGQSENSEVR